MTENSPRVDSRRVVSMDTALPAEALLEPPIAASTLQALATRAVDAAAQAGATYADVRIAAQQVLEPNINLIQMNVSLRAQCTYGVRALVNGVWGFAYGRTPTTDAITQCAADAVAAARLAAHASTGTAASTPDWLPPPSITGEWRMPIQIDPFTVPLQHQGELMSAFITAIGHVPDALITLNVTWDRETRVLAASTGTLVTQYYHRVRFEQNSYVTYGHTWVGLRIPELQGASRGYEVLLTPGLQDRIKMAAEDAMALTRLPKGAIDVGRYPVVFDGITMGALLTHLVGPALELDRVLGDDLDSAGTSPFALDRLGTPVASPFMTVTGHRTAPSINATQWDDEGTVSHEHTVIRQGVLNDYHTSSQTVAALANWYHRQQRPLRANGCATAVEASHNALLQAPHLTMAAHATPYSIEALCRDVSRGILVVQQDYVTPDPHLRSASLYATVKAPMSGVDMYAGGMLFEISRGKLVRRLDQTALQFNTRRFLQGLTAVGGPETMCHTATWVSKGVPWQVVWKGASAPAALFKEIDAMSVG